MLRSVQAFQVLTILLANISCQSLSPLLTPLPASGSQDSRLNRYSSFLRPLAFSHPRFTWWPFKNAWPLLLLPAWSSSGVPHHLQHKGITLWVLWKALQGLATTSSNPISQHSSPVISCSRSRGPFVTWKYTWLCHTSVPLLLFFSCPWMSSLLTVHLPKGHLAASYFPLLIWVLGVLGSH